MLGSQNSRIAEPPFARPSVAIYVCGVLTIAWILAYLDRGLLTLVIPGIKQSLGLSDTEVSLVQGMAFSLVFAFAGLPIGRVVDRLNRRNLMIAGVLIWSFATLACGLADNFWELFFARAAVGVGEACLAPASFSLLSDFVAPQRRGKAIGVVSSGSAIGTAGSGIIGGLLLNALSAGQFGALPWLDGIAPWRIVFGIFALPGIVVAMLLMTFKEPVRRGEGLHAAPSDNLFLPFLKANRKVFLPLLSSMAIHIMVVFSFTAWGPMVFVRRYNMAPGDVGVMMGSILLGVGIGAALLGGHFADAMLKRYPRDGRLRVPLVTYPCLLVCLALLAVPNFHANLLAYAGAKMVSTMSAPAAYAALQDLCPNRMRGQVVAVYSLLGNIVGMSFGVTLVALITDHVFGDETLIAWSIIVAGVPLTLISLFLAVAAIRNVGTMAASVTGRDDDSWPKV